MQSAYADEAARDDAVESLRRMWEFAMVLGFLRMFRNALELPEFTPEDLEQELLNTKESSLLTRLHIRLLKGLLIHGQTSKAPSVDGWERTLRTKMSEKYTEFWDANPLSQIGSYYELSPEQRVLILRALCEWAFDENERIQDAVRNWDADELRKTPIGTDSKGYTYFWFGDMEPPDICDLKFRVFRESAPVMVGRTKKVKIPAKWETITVTMGDLEEFIQNLSRLKSRVDKQLHNALNKKLPEIQELYSAWEKKQRKTVAMQVMMEHPRQSSRLAKKAEQQAEVSKKKEEQRKATFEKLAAEDPLALLQDHLAKTRAERAKRRELLSLLDSTGLELPTGDGNASGSESKHPQAAASPTAPDQSPSPRADDDNVSVSRSAASPAPPVASATCSTAEDIPPPKSPPKSDPECFDDASPPPPPAASNHSPTVAPHPNPQAAPDPPSNVFLAHRPQSGHAGGAAQRWKRTRKIKEVDMASKYLEYHDDEPKRKRSRRSLPSRDPYADPNSTSPPLTPEDCFTRRTARRSAPLPSATQPNDSHLPSAPLPQPSQAPKKPKAPSKPRAPKPQRSAGMQLPGSDISQSEAGVHNGGGQRPQRPPQQSTAAPRHTSQTRPPPVPLHNDDPLPLRPTQAHRTVPTPARPDISHARTYYEAEPSSYERAFAGPNSGAQVVERRHKLSPKEGRNEPPLAPAAPPPESYSRSSHHTLPAPNPHPQRFASASSSASSTPAGMSSLLRPSHSQSSGPKLALTPELVAQMRNNRATSGASGPSNMAPMPTTSLLSHQQKPSASAPSTSYLSPANTDPSSGSMNGTVSFSSQGPSSRRPSGLDALAARPHHSSVGIAGSPSWQYHASENRQLPPSNPPELRPSGIASHQFAPPALHHSQHASYHQPMQPHHHATSQSHSFFHATESTAADSAPMHLSSFGMSQQPSAASRGMGAVNPDAIRFSQQPHRQFSAPNPPLPSSSETARMAAFEAPAASERSRMDTPSATDALTPEQEASLYFGGDRSRGPAPGNSLLMSRKSSLI